jgi:uncharacterized membrane protein
MAGATAPNPYWKQTPDGPRLQADPGDFIKHGVLVAFLLPVAVALLAGLMLAAVYQPRAPMAANVVGVCALCSGGFFFGLGVLMAAAGPWRAGKQWALVRDGTLVLPDGDVLSRGALSALIVDKPNSLMKWWAISAQLTSGERHVLIGKLPPTRVPLVRAAAAEAAALLAIPLNDEQAAVVSKLGVSRNDLASLCYLPIEGIGLVVSLGCLVFSKDSYLRFCARQSLSFFVGSGCLVAVVVVVAMLPVVLLPERIGGPIAGVLVLLLVLPLTIARLVMMLVAGWRARRGRLWVIPGMGWLSRRWLPVEEEGAV